ncbi:MAG TPA: methyltransferase [Streptosporangiaceae bacterium]|nr:methyltransferase [Streptosporangiaceae bacterium]
METAERSASAPPARMMELTTGTWVSQAISAAAELGVADALADGPRHVDDIATTVGADPAGLYRLLRALADIEVFAELDGRRFASTPLGDLLRDEAPGSLRHWAIMVGRPFHRAAWTGLLDGVRTGASAFERTHGARAWDYLQANPADGRVMDAAMTTVSSQIIAPAFTSHDFGSARTVVDVGGGQGALLAAILTANPHIRGVLFDLPHVVAGRVAGFGERCVSVAGDFFESVPAGGDVHVLSNIIHDWDDDAAVRILRNCRAALNPGGRVLLGESVLPDEIRPSRAKWMDLEMLVMNVRGARQRTRREYRDLFARAGLRLTRIMGDGEVFALVEGVPERDAPEHGAVERTGRRP